jgi:predicted nucleic acid-binding Zn ribbon protein
VLFEILYRRSILHSNFDQLIAKCPKCGDKADRKISVTTFKLKGNGWYKKDYGDKK